MSEALDILNCKVTVVIVIVTQSHPETKMRRQIMHPIKRRSESGSDVLDERGNIFSDVVVMQGGLVVLSTEASISFWRCCLDA